MTFFHEKKIMFSVDSCIVEHDGKNRLEYKCSAIHKQITLMSRILLSESKTNCSSEQKP